jgi:hypothetical protein
MEMTTYDMERPAMPVAAPVGAVAPGSTIAVPNALQVHGISVKPWTTRYDRQIGHLFGRALTGRSARHLGRTST